MAALAAIAAGSVISAGATIGASLGAADMQAKNSQNLQNQNLDFQKSLVDRGEKSFTDAGMPKFAYWSGGMGNLQNLPGTNTNLGGNNFAHSMGVNSDLPYYTTSPWSQWTGLGKPNAPAKPFKASPQQQQPVTFHNDNDSDLASLSDFGSSNLETSSNLSGASSYTNVFTGQAPYQERANHTFAEPMFDEHFNPDLEGDPIGMAYLTNPQKNYSPIIDQWFQGARTNFFKAPGW